TADGVFGVDEDEAVLDSVASLAGVPVAHGGGVLPADAVGATSYYGDTPPAYYTAADVAQLDSVTAAWGGGVPRYALIVAKYARDLLRRSGARQVNFVSASFGSLIVRWLIEKDVEGLAGTGAIARWLSIEGLIAGNWAASRGAVSFLSALNLLPIDVTHMSYDWVSTHLHTPRTEADDPAYAGALVGQMVSTDDSDNDAALSLLMESYKEFQPNDGVQAAGDARFQQVTARSRLDSLPPTLDYFHTDHYAIKHNRAAWAQAATFMTQRRRVTVTVTSAQVTNSHEANDGFWDPFPAEVVLESRAYSPALATRWGIVDPVSTIEKEGAVAPLRLYAADGQTQIVDQLVFDDLVLEEETQLRLVLRAETIDEDWRYGVFEAVAPPYTHDLGGGELMVSTLAPGTYAFHTTDWSGTVTVAIHDYGFPLLPPLAAPPAVVLGGPGVLRAWPNPHGAQVRIVIQGLAPSVGPVPGTLEVFDVSGRRVRRLDGDVRTGFFWDGRDATGARLASGVYVLRVATALGRWTGRSVLER
ncbi:MAG TPA: hypothetical protein VFJ24_04880, partial [Gaiellales bacterium]|nr:hypothetical protein [Gaiellales bacterium]